MHGVWDIDELYDLQEDPLETNNLIFSEQHRPILQKMNARLFEIMKDTGGMQIPLYPDSGGQSKASVIGRSFVASTVPAAPSQTTPATWRGPSGIWTIEPGPTRMPSGTA